MKFKMVRAYFFSAGVLLLITAIAKFVSAGGNAHILQNSDPIMSIPYRDIFWIVGALELVASIICFSSKRFGLQAGLIAWLSTSFIVYRLGLSWIGYHKPCPCLGNLTDALHISPQTIDTIMKIVLAYLLVGSYATLFWLWKKNQSSAVAMKPVP